MNRKNPCKKYTETHSIIETPTPPIVGELKQKRSYDCPYCDKSFTTNSNMNKHINRSCKQSNEKHEIIRLKEENKILQSQLTTINNTQTNYFNTQNIIINSFGNEELQHILPKIPILIKNFPTTAVTDMICETYYDPKHPENKTVKIRNTKEKWAHTFNGESWDVHRKMDTILDVLQKSFKLIDDFYEKHNIEPPEYMKNKVTWEEIRNMWYNDIYPNQEMKDTVEKILINQNQTGSSFREFLDKCSNLKNDKGNFVK